MACPFTKEAERKIRASRHTARDAKDGLLRFMAITPKTPKAEQNGVEYTRGASGGCQNLSHRYRLP
jgi:hypothetical protein